MDAWDLLTSIQFDDTSRQVLLGLQNRDNGRLRTLYDQEYYTDSQIDVPSLELVFKFYTHGHMHSFVELVQEKTRLSSELKNR